MEYVFLRFPHLCEQIFSELGNDCLTRCREVCRGWKPAIDNLSILMIQRYTKCSKKLLKTIIKKENLVDLAYQIQQLYEKYPITSSKKRMTPLHEAAKVGNFPILELIIENHENINCSDGYGWTPLHWAAESGHLEICQLILPLVTEKNQEDKYGKTAFDVAFQNQHWKVCGLIIENSKNEIGDFLKKSEVLTSSHHEKYECLFNIENLRSLSNALLEIGKLPLCKIINDAHRSMCESGWRNYDHNLNTFDLSTVLPDHGEQESLISEENMVDNDTTNPKQICLPYSAKTFWISLIYTFIGFTIFMLCLEAFPYDVRWFFGIFDFPTYIMRTNLLNWCDLVSISKNVVFYAFGVVSIYLYLADLLQKKS